jgi:hypothetical protein
MKTRIAVAAIAASLLLLGGLFALATPALAVYGSDTSTSSFMGDRMSMLGSNEKGKMFGVISSEQNEDGDPAWILTGQWAIRNETGTANITDINAGFQMIRLDGTDGHTHKISNFTQTANTTTEGNETTVSGTTTVTMPGGPVNDVDTEITVSGGKTISISLDPDDTDGHFGDTPIYGIVITPEMIQQFMNTTRPSMGGNMTGGNMTGGNMTGGNETGT